MISQEFEKTSINNRIDTILPNIEKLALEENKKKFNDRIEVVKIYMDKMKDSLSYEKINSILNDIEKDIESAYNIEKSSKRGVIMGIIFISIMLPATAVYAYQEGNLIAASGAFGLLIIIWVIKLLIIK